MFKTMKSRLIGAGVGMALVGSTLGGVATIGATSVAAQTVPPTATVTQAASPEAPEPAGEKPDANEPALPGGGHADPAGDAQHDFQGVE